MEPDSHAVTVVARAALDDPRAEVAAWERTPLSWLAIAPTTAELTRYGGTTTDGRTWSAILKVLRRPGPQWRLDWRREADVYASGMLDGLPPGVVAPRVYGIDGTGDSIELWLEEVVESVPEWRLDRYATAARDLGRFNGAYLAGWPRPSSPALETGMLAGWVAMIGERALEILDDPTIVEDELVRRAIPTSWHDRLRELHSHRAHLLTALEQLPLTVSHLDAWRANLIARDRDGMTETVAIDWSICGLAPAGQEIAIFVTGARCWLALAPGDAAALGDLAYRSYVDGLREAGWAGEEADVRFAYAASAALWAGIPAPVWLRWFTLPARQEWLERKFRMPLGAAAAPFGEFIGYALDLGDEALAAVGR